MTPTFKTDREALLYAIHELRNALVPLNCQRDLSDFAKRAVGRGLEVAANLANHAQTVRDQTPGRVCLNIAHVGSNADLHEEYERVMDSDGENQILQSWSWVIGDPENISTTKFGEVFREGKHTVVLDNISPNRDMGATDYIVYGPDPEGVRKFLGDFGLYDVEILSEERITRHDNFK